MNVTGLDLSLTATGVAYHDGTVATLRTKEKGMARLQWLRDQIVDTYLTGDDPLVVIEGYAFGRPQQASHLGELGGVIRLAMFEECIPFVDVPPACVKVFATGKGNAGKEEVLAAAIRRLGYQGHDNNEADALWLRAMGCHAMGCPVVDVPATHARGLDKVEWPKAVGA